MLLNRLQYVLSKLRLKHDSKVKLLTVGEPTMPMRRLLLSSIVLFGILSRRALAASRQTSEAREELPSLNKIVNSTLPLVLPKAISSAKEIDGEIAGYLISEKLDGVRAYWDGKQLYFRSGRVINAPTWFMENFPTHPMDGELWMGRAQFELLSGAVRRQIPQNEEWRKIHYCLFELPLATGDFRTRFAALEKTVHALQIPWLSVIPQKRLSTVEQLDAKLKQLVLQKGEGLVLHKSDALFQAGRSEDVLKLKPQHDAEAKVIAILPGRGKYDGMMGALLVETKNGQRFKLGTGFDDAMRKNPPPIGTVLTYRYRDLTANGLPKFASFIRVFHPE